MTKASINSEPTPRIIFQAAVKAPALESYVAHALLTQSILESALRCRVEGLGSLATIYWSGTKFELAYNNC